MFIAIVSLLQVVVTHLYALVSAVWLPDGSAVCF